MVSTEHADGVAVIQINNLPVNALSEGALLEKLADAGKTFRTFDKEHAVQE